MKILKVKDTVVALWDLRDFFDSKEILVGQRFGISWKIGKRKKLRSYTLINYGCRNCSDCGNYTFVEIGKGGKTLQLDNHCGLASMGIRSL